MIWWEIWQSISMQHAATHILWQSNRYVEYKMLEIASEWDIRVHLDFLFHSSEVIVLTRWQLLNLSSDLHLNNSWMHITWVGCGIERRHGQASQPLERSLLEFKNVRCHKDAAGEKMKRKSYFLTEKRSSLKRQPPLYISQFCSFVCRAGNNQYKQRSDDLERRKDNLSKQLLHQLTFDNHRCQLQQNLWSWKNLNHLQYVSG